MLKLQKRHGLNKNFAAKHFLKSQAFSIKSGCRDTTRKGCLGDKDILNEIKYKTIAKILEGQDHGRRQREAEGAVPPLDFHSWYKYSR